MGRRQPPGSEVGAKRIDQRFLDPEMEIAQDPEQGCPGCTMFADNLPNLTHLNARDTTMVSCRPVPRGD